MTEPAEDDLLQQCPRCDYSLRGLPAEHYCPECGLTLDRRWRVFGGRSLWRTWSRSVFVYMLFVMGLPLLAAAIFVAGGFVRLRAMPRADAPLLLPLLFCAVVGACRTAWAFSRLRRFVAVRPRGLAVYRGAKQAEEYAWDRIGRAKYEFIGKRVSIQIDGKPMRISANSFFRGDIFGAEGFIRCVNHYPRPPGRSTSRRHGP